MAQNKSIKMAVVGVGNMGRQHARDIHTLPHTELVAVCDIKKETANNVAEKYQVQSYTNHQELLEACELDAILIATPHYSHPEITLAAFEKGLHVLVEKPIAVHVKDGQMMIDAYEAAKETHPDLVFGAVFMQRTYGYFRKIKDLIDSNELGKLVRATWIITDWFRPQVYYDSGGWRATWAGEGGGVLLNQCPHNLDLFQWFVGMPDRITGFAAIGKYHHIEVEDEVTAFFEYDNGLVGHFITSTGESPGTNRLEIVGDKGKLIFENGKLRFFRNRQPMLTFIEEATGPFDKVENWEIDLPFSHHGQPGHKHIIENFANAILFDEVLIAPAVEGIHSIMLSNAIMLSSFLNKTVSLPIDADLFAQKLAKLVESSQFKKTTRSVETTDMSKSF